MLPEKSLHFPYVLCKDRKGYSNNQNIKEKGYCTNRIDEMRSRSLRRRWPSTSSISSTTGGEGYRLGTYPLIPETRQQIFPMYVILSPMIIFPFFSFGHHFRYNICRVFIWIFKCLVCKFRCDNILKWISGALEALGGKVKYSPSLD